MLQKRKPDHFRILLRPLACATASALFLSTTVARAEAIDGEVPFSNALPDSDGESLEDTRTTFDVAPLATLARWSSAVALVDVTRPALLGGATRSAAASGTAAATAPAPTDTATTPAAPAKDEDGTVRMAGYIAGGVGIVGMVLFAVAGIGAKNAHDRLDENCRDRPCDPVTRASDVEDGKLLQTAANIGLATGLVGLGLGATLIVAGGRGSNDAPPAPGPTATGGMVTYGARF